MHYTHYSMKIDSMTTAAVGPRKADCGKVTQVFSSVPTCPKCRAMMIARMRTQLAFLGPKGISKAIAKYFEGSGDEAEEPG